MAAHVDFEQVEKLCLLKDVRGDEAYDLRIDVVLVDVEVGRLFHRDLFGACHYVTVIGSLSFELFGQVLSHIDILHRLRLTAEQNSQVVSQLLLLGSEVPFLLVLLLVVVKGERHVLLFFPEHLVCHDLVHLVSSLLHMVSFIVARVTNEILVDIEPVSCFVKIDDFDASRACQLTKLFKGV
jgi:hypothetical protein